LLRSIQVLRGLAACGVVFLHASGAQWGARGAAGVDLFFVISGFIMASIPKRPSFLFDRFWRIYPLWWIALVPWIFLSEPHPGYIDTFAVSTSMTLLPVGTPLLPVGWTLSFELLFYLAVALSLRTGVKPLLAIFGLFLTGAVLTKATLFNFIGNPMILEFLFGAMVAKLPRYSKAALPLLIFACICLASAPTWIYPPEFAMRAPASAWRVLYWGVPSAMVVYACLSVETLFAHRLWNAAVLLGDASYSIYLFHLAVTDNLARPWAVEFVLAIFAGLAAWRFIERPILAAKPRFSPVSGYA
jgi:exopolysaccharide production protein ExoZ